VNAYLDDETLTEVDPYAAPANDEEVFRKYYRYVQHLVGKLGVPEGMKEDVAADILCRFYERHMLEEYDPELEFEIDGRKRPARFLTFLSGFVTTYTLGKKERHLKREGREPKIADAPYRDTGSPWIEMFGPVQPSDHSEVEAADLISCIRAFLVEVPRKSDRDRCDLPRLFDLVTEMTWNDGKIDAKELMREFGISYSAIHSWLRYLQTQVQEAMESLGFERTERRGWVLARPC